MPEFNGTAGANSISGTEDADVINGLAGNDTLRGFGGDDELNGNEDSDLLTGGLGDDILDGGDGGDRAGYYNINATMTGVTVSLLLQGDYQDTVGQGFDYLRNIEHVSGTPYADTLTGDDGDNWLWGSAATIAPGEISATNNDTLDGGAGNDLLTVGIGNHMLIGGDGGDTVRFTENGSPEPDITIDLQLQGAAQSTGAGDWTLISIQNLSGGVGNDVLSGDSGFNLLAGDLGNDTISGRDGNDLILGDGYVRVDASGIISHSYDSGSAGGNDSLSGDGGDDALYGGAGNDMLEGGTGQDDLNGGAGNDTASYALAGGGVTALLYDGGFGEAFGAAGYDQLHDMENLLGSGFNDILYANNLDNVVSGGEGHDDVRGGAGNDQIFGGAGDDLLYGNAGDDLLDGGDGIDRAAYYSGATAGVHVDLNLQGVAQDTGQGLDTLIGIEFLSGTAFADTLIGDSGNNILWGSASTISPGNVAPDNDDTLDGGAGDDLLVVGIGSHMLMGGSGVDTVRFTENDAAESGLTLSLDLQGQPQNSGNGDWTLTGIENLSGSRANDNLSGDGNANVLAGDIGNDTLSGGGGDDTLYGDGQIAWDGHGVGRSGPVTTTIDATGLYVGAVAGNDTLNGGAGNDTIYGGGGVDTAFGGDGADTIYGGEGNDQLYGGSIINSAPQPLDEADTIYGESGNDVIRGGSGDDYLDGGEGDDNLRGDLGNDTLIGGAGRDFVSYRFDDSGVTSGVYFDAQNFASSGSFTMSDGRGGTDTLSDVEHLGITGSAYDDVLIGSQFALSTATSVANVISGNGGNDWLYGGGQVDQLDGGDGNDVAFGFGGNDFITGGAGDDQLLGGSGNDILDSGIGDDHLVGDVGDDTIIGGAGHDSVGYNFNVAAVTSGIVFDGTDFGATSDFTWSDGRGGTDTISGVEALSVGGSAYDDILAGSFSTTSTDTRVANQLFGNDGNDIISGGDQWDQLDGGNGNDFIEGYGGGDGINGGAGNDRLLGGDGNDYVDGGADADYITGGFGDDIIVGGSGVDRAGYYQTNAALGGVVVSLAVTGSQDTGSQGWDTLSGIENLSGTPFADTLTGDDNSNWLWGSVAFISAGNTSATNNDTIDGGGGNDLLQVGIGNHTLAGGGETDTVRFTENGGPENDLTVSLAIAGAQATGNGTWTLSGIENLSGGTANDSLTGDGLVNVLAGDAGDDRLSGGGGNDLLYGDGTILFDGTAGVIATTADAGANGSDRIEGGLGDDLINGGGGSDTASYENAAGAVTVNLAAGIASGADGNDTLVSIENLLGGAFDDTLVGSGGDNNIAGGGGVDTLVGLGGYDLLDGGAGSDNLYGMQGNDTLLGGDGNDNLRGGTGDDLIDGGSGFNLAGYFPVLSDTIGNGVTVDLRLQGVAQNTGQGLDTLVNIQGLAGTNFADTLIGNDQTNVLIAAGSLTGSAGGDDQLFGMEGDDLLIVGSGTLLLDGGLNSDTISFNAAGGTLLNGVTVSLMAQGSAQNTGSGNMTLVDIENLSGTGFADVFTGDGNANTLSGAGGDDTLNGGDGDDLLLGDGVYTAFTVAGPLQAPTLVMDATVYAGQVAGNDLLHGGAGNDTIYGAGGNDLAFGGDNADTIYGGDGNDELYGGSITTSAPQPLDESDTIYGEAGNDVIRGGGGDDTLDGGEGDDNLRGDLGNDTLIGGAGRDFVSYRFDDAGVTSGVYFDGTYFAATATFTQDDGRGGTDTLSDVEALGVTGSGFDDIIMGSQYTVSTATQVANQLFGFGGNDEIYGGGYWDQLDGGDGNDYIDGADGGDGINGGAGNDRLIGGGGGDFIDGGADVDYITGGEGDDIIVGGDGRDRAGYYHTNAALGGVTVSLATTTIQAVGGGQGNDTISGVEALSGTPFADTLTGDGGDNWLWGSAATISASNVSATNNDRLDGGAGNDLLTVGIGNHMLIGGDGIDTLRFTENNSAVTEAGLTLSLASLKAQSTGNGSWTLSGIENLSGGTGSDKLTGDDLNNVLAGDLGADTLTGGIGNDVLIGDGFINVDAGLAVTTTYDREGGGNDTLVGGRGEDFLYGGRGDDTLTGGADSDWFVLQAHSGNDRVTDFGRTDRIAFDFAGAPDEYSDLTIVAYRGGTLISWGTSDSIHLEGVRTSAVSASNFFFGAPALPSASAAEAPAIKTFGDSPTLDSGPRFDHLSLQQDMFLAHRPGDLLGF